MMAGLKKRAGNSNKFIEGTGRDRGTRTRRGGVRSVRWGITTAR